MKLEALLFWPHSDRRAEHLSSEGLCASSVCDWFIGDRPHRPRLCKLLLAMALLHTAHGFTRGMRVRNVADGVVVGRAHAVRREQGVAQSQVRCRLKPRRPPSLFYSPP